MEKNGFRCIYYMMGQFTCVCGCRTKLTGSDQILEHHLITGHTLVCRGTLFRPVVSEVIRELKELALRGEFRAVCGCGFATQSLEKATQHAMKGHATWFVISLSSEGQKKRVKPHRPSRKERPLRVWVFTSTEEVKRKEGNNNGQIN